MLEFRQETYLLVPLVPWTPVLSNYVLSDVNFGSHLAWSGTASEAELAEVAQQVTLTLHKGPGQKEFVPHYQVDFCTDHECKRCHDFTGGYKFRRCSSRWTPSGCFCFPEDAGADIGTIGRSPGAARFFCQRECFPFGGLRIEGEESEPFKATLAKGAANFRTTSCAQRGELRRQRIQQDAAAAAASTATGSAGA